MTLMCTATLKFGQKSQVHTVSESSGGWSVCDSSRSRTIILPSITESSATLNPILHIKLVNTLLAKKKYNTTEINSRSREGAKFGAGPGRGASEVAVCQGSWSHQLYMQEGPRTLYMGRRVLRSAEIHKMEGKG